MFFASTKHHRAGEWIVLALVLLTALWHGGKTLESTWLLAGIAALLTVLHWWKRGADQCESHDVPVAMWMIGIALILWITASFIVSSTQNYGLDEVLRITSLILIFFWAVRRRTEKDHMSFGEKLMITITAAAIAACLIGLFVYTFQPVTRFVGSFFNQRFNVDYWPNAWAEFLLLAWPVAIYSVRRLKPVWQIIVIGLLTGCLFLSYSRGAVLVFGAQCGLMLVLAAASLLRSPRRHLLVRRVLIVTAGSIALAIAVFFAMNAIRANYHPVESIGAKVTFTADEGKSSVNERRQFWEQAVTLSLERPLLGWGPYSFRFVQPRLQTGVFETSDHPHNVFLKFAMENGWPAALLFFVFLLSVFVPLGLKVVKSWRGHGDPISFFEISAITAIAGVLLHNQIDYNLQFVGIALPMWLLMGAGLRPAMAGKYARPRQTATFGHTIEAAIALILIAVTVVEGGFLVTSLLGRRAEGRGDVISALEWYRASRGEIFSRDMLLGDAAIHLYANSPAPEILESLDLYFAKNSEDARAWQMKGDALRAAKKDQEALEAYGQAFTLGKYNLVGVTTAIVDILRAQNNRSELIRRHDELIEIYDAYGSAILQNTHFIAISQNVEQFETLSDALIRVYPADWAAIKDLKARAIGHAREVRTEFQAKPAGLLW